MLPTSTHISVMQCGDSVRVSARRYTFSKDDIHPRDRATLSPEEIEWKDAVNTYRSITRAANNFVALADANKEDLRYWVTLPFNPMESAAGIDLQPKLQRWLSRRFERHGISAKYLMAFVPNRSGVWHCHMLLGDVPKGEFVRPSVAPECASKDTLNMEAEGCDVFVWPSFYDRFQSLSHVVPFGAYDRSNCQVQVYGKAAYCACQHFPEYDRGQYIYDRAELIQAMKHYRDNIPKHRRAYFSSRNLAKPKKLFSGFIPPEIAEEMWYDIIGKHMGRLGSATAVCIDSVTFEALRISLEEYGEFKEPELSL